MKNSYVSDLRQEFRGYNGAKFAKDLMAGVTVAAVALPLALAFGVSSGATAASGLLDCCHLRLCHQSVGRRLLSDFRSHRSHGRGAHVHCGPVRPVRRLYGHCDGRYHSGPGRYSPPGQGDSLYPHAGYHRLYLGHFRGHRPGPAGQLFRHHVQGSTAVEKVLSYFTVGFSVNPAAVLLGSAIIVL